MKKLFAILMVVMLLCGVLSINAFAAEYDYVTVTGTMNGWNPASEADRMTKQSDGVYIITYENMAAGSYEFKFTANGNWSDLDLGGAFLGSGVESQLSWGGSNICFTLEETQNVTITVDVVNYTFVLTIGDLVEEAPAEMVLHVSVPESWGATYVYVWGPEHLGTWPGTYTETGDLTVVAAFEGMVINNGNGTQSWDIKDIDLFSETEVWITVNEDGSYALSYEAPVTEEPTPDPDPVPEGQPIKINVIAEHWNNIYAYTYNPELTGSWPGTLVENGVFETLNTFEGLVLNNGEGQQTADIKDIDMEKAEVWITVNADNSYTLSYEAPVIETPSEDTNQRTGDSIFACVAALALSATCLVFITRKKNQ